MRPVLGSTLPSAEVWGKGSEGGLELAEEVACGCAKSRHDFHFAYELDKPITEKIETIVTEDLRRRAA